MRIVHLLGWYFPDSVGGTEVYVEGLCRRLQEAGHEVSIAAPDSHRVAPAQYDYHGVPVFGIRSTPIRHATRPITASRCPGPSTCSAGSPTSVPTSCTSTASRPESGSRSSGKHNVSASV